MSQLQTPSWSLFNLTSDKTLSHEDTTLLRNRRLQSEYAVGKKIGEGHYGVVREVTDRTAGKRRAVKSVSKKGLKTERQKNHLRTEVSIATELSSHPNFTRLHDVFEGRSNVHMVMELCEGGDLFNHIVDRGRLTEPEAAWILRSAASALAHSHEHGILHRDVKPENILLKKSWKPQAPLESSTSTRRCRVCPFSSPHNSDPSATATSEPSTAKSNILGPIPGQEVKVADFGLSIRLSPGSTAHGLSGSPAYCAPEVITGRSYGFAADMWSLGVVLFMMLSGDLPFKGRQTRLVMRRVRIGKFDCDSLRWTGVSAEAKALVKNLLSVDPSARPSAASVLESPWVVENSAVWEAAMQGV